MLHYTVWKILTDVSEELSARKIRVTHQLDDADRKPLWNVSQYLPDYTKQHPKRQPTSRFILTTYQYRAIKLHRMTNILNVNMSHLHGFRSSTIIFIQIRGKNFRQASGQPRVLNKNNAKKYPELLCVFQCNRISTPRKIKTANKEYNQKWTPALASLKP